MRKPTMVDIYTFSRVSTKNKAKLLQIKEFLCQHQLTVDDDVEHFVVAYGTNQIIACGGIAGHVLKSIAVSPALQGTGFALKLMTELTNFAYEMGRFSLFLFTKPANVDLFRQCGFFLVDKVEPHIALLENSPNRLSVYCKQLRLLKMSGRKIGSIVMNANPFTLGHQYLIEQACEQCDWVHLFVVKAENKDFSYADRMAMIKAGSKHLLNLTIHSGSDYIISRATFPSYFIKDQQVVNQSHTALDLSIFRHSIAPALGITHRFVGSEPICTVTRHYNQAMRRWLEEAHDVSASIQVVEIERSQQASQPISASRVRYLLKQFGVAAIADLVPKTTYSYLCQHYAEHSLQTAPQRLAV
ncbi:[citrate (pro-3S)-lyase] ligase [Vibrio cholerae]|nr:[citrate (pro-3S)-lyase] ligase [Vibrio cholerae]